VVAKCVGGQLEVDPVAATGFDAITGELRRMIIERPYDGGPRLKIQHEGDVIHRLLFLRTRGRHEGEDAFAVRSDVEVRQDACVRERVRRPLSWRACDERAGFGFVRDDHESLRVGAIQQFVSIR